MMTRTKVTDSIYICKEVINIRLRANIFANYPDAMSLTDLAGALGISTKLASRLVRSGEIFGVKVGREYRVAKTSVMEYIEDARVAYPKRRKNEKQSGFILQKKKAHRKEVRATKCRRI